MINKEHHLPIGRQARLLSLSRSSVYYLPRPVPAADLAVMNRIDKLHLEYPFAGSRMMRDFLVRENFDVGRLHVATLMRKMGIEAIYRRPNTSKPAPGHKIYPYLLRKLPITRPNQVWAMDITYIPMARGFVYLAAVVTGSAGRYWPGNSRSRSTRHSASKPSRRHWRNTASRKSSTRTRVASSHPWPSPIC